jgi:hypothetical protein
MKINRTIAGLYLLFPAFLMADIRKSFLTSFLVVCFFCCGRFVSLSAQEADAANKIYYFPCSMQEYIDLKPSLVTLGDDINFNFVEEPGVASWLVFKINPQKAAAIPSSNEYLQRRVSRTFPNKQLSELIINDLPSSDIKTQIQNWFSPPSNPRRDNAVQEPVILIEFASVEDKVALKPQLAEWLKENDNYKAIAYKDNSYLLVFPATENPMSNAKALAIKNQLEVSFPNIKVELHTYQTLR